MHAWQIHDLGEIDNADIAGRQGRAAGESGQLDRPWRAGAVGIERQHARRAIIQERGIVIGGRRIEQQAVAGQRPVGRLPKYGLATSILSMPERKSAIAPEPLAAKVNTSPPVSPVADALLLLTLLNAKVMAESMYMSLDAL